MKPSFTTKLVLSHVGLAALVLVLAATAAAAALDAALEYQLDATLEEQARGAAEWARAGRHPHQVAERLGHVLGARVSVISEAGYVLGDSERPGEEDPDLPQANELPEVVQARAGGVGRATRRADSGAHLVRYVAVRAGAGRVLRVGAPLSALREAQRSLQVPLGLATLAALGVAVLLGVVLARRVVRPLQAMTVTATRIAGGDFDASPGVAGGDEMGVLAGALASLGTQLKARIGELTGERDRLNAVLHGMVEGVLVVDSAGTILDANPSARAVLGHAEPLAGRRLADVAQAAFLAGGVAHALGTAGFYQGERTLADERHVTVNVRALSAPVGGGAVVVLHDVTELRRLDASRRDFLANVSHELRTPVAAIQGYAETLVAGQPDAATAREFLETIHRHAGRIGRLVSDLLTLSALDSAPAPATAKEAVALEPVARQVAQTLKDRAATRGMRLVVNVDADAVCMGHGTAVEQVLENLVDNACKYGREGGTITVTARRVDGGVRVEVADDGPGIEARHVPHLFERFYRVDAGRSRGTGGTGLGLAIVRALVESMGGSAGITSAPGVGTTVHVVLPAWRGAVSA